MVFEPSIKIGKRTFLTALALLATLMTAAGILTRIIPAGLYDRTITDGREVLVAGSYHVIDRPDIPVWRWLTAPVEILASETGLMAVFIILFMFAIAASITLLEKSSVLPFAIDAVIRRVSHRKYTLMATIVLFFMLLSAVLGTFEENLVLVPVIVALAYRLNWDSLTGLGMSLLASCFGFTAALTNPFSIAINQRIAGLPLYSGLPYRILIFLVYYGLLMSFLLIYTRRIEKNPERSPVYSEDLAVKARMQAIDEHDAQQPGSTPQQRKQLKKAVWLVVAFTGVLIAAIGLAAWLPTLANLLFPLMGTLLMAASILASRVAGLSGPVVFRMIGLSGLGVAPVTLLILMAMSVRYIIDRGEIIDTILHYMAELISRASPYGAILLIYMLILFLELFIGASSAKAFLIMPLIAPLAELVDISRQTAVLAFSFGDGFSNVLYPTNPVLIICLGLTVVTYPKWMKWTLRLQIIVFLLACAFLLLAVRFSYGPF